MLNYSLSPYVAPEPDNKYTNVMHYLDTSTGATTAWDRLGLSQGEYNLAMLGYNQQNNAMDKQIAAERENAATQVAAQKELTAMNLGAQQASADKEMAFNAEQAALTREFNAAEAQKDREWQEMMSNTAYQRVVKDLQAAGINPLLAVSQGGAAYGNGATASAQTTYGSHVNGSAATASKANAQIADMSKIVSSALSVLTSKLDRENSYKMQSQYLRAMRDVASINNQTNGFGNVLRLVGTLAIAGFLL